MVYDIFTYRYRESSNKADGFSVLLNHLHRLSGDRAVNHSFITVQVLQERFRLTKLVTTLQNKSAWLWAVFVTGVNKKTNDCFTHAVLGRRAVDILRFWMTERKQETQQTLQNWALNKGLDLELSKTGRPKTIIEASLALHVSVLLYQVKNPANHLQLNRLDWLKPFYLLSTRKKKQTTPVAAMISPGTMKDIPQAEET